MGGRGHQWLLERSMLLSLHRQRLATDEAWGKSTRATHHPPAVSSIRDPHGEVGVGPNRGICSPAARPCSSLTPSNVRHRRYERDCWRTCTAPLSGRLLPQFSTLYHLGPARKGTSILDTYALLASQLETLPQDSRQVENQNMSRPPQRPINRLLIANRSFHPLPTIPA
jgi:hypothetical protein